MSTPAASSYREIDAHAFSNDSTWMNLGLWTLPTPALHQHENKSNTKSRFTLANENLARRIGQLLLATGPAITTTTIVDLGCGRGDSLCLWDAEFSPHFKSMIGVNYSEPEFLAASDKVRMNPRIQVVHADAVEFLLSTPLSDASIVSVDALYHFRPNRIDFFKACRTSGAVRMAMSDIVLSEKWAREEGRMDFLTHTVRNLFLSAVCSAGGIPRDNLAGYGPVDLTDVLQACGWKQQQVEVVTDQVFVPFAEYCSQRAQSYSWFSKRKWSLLTSGWFMRCLNWMQAVDFVLYSAVPL